MGTLTTPIKRIKGLIAQKGLMGQSQSYADFSKKWKVILDANMDAKDMADTLLHETMHQISELKKLNLKEGQVEKLSNSLVYAMADKNINLRDTIERINGIKQLKLSDSQIQKLVSTMRYVISHNPKYMSIIRKVRG
jgi:Asp-tRNA(Asn)/Glu-tRNA(Gln) amidotransferase C subunit